MLAAGNTASRTREWIDVLATKMGFDGMSLSLSFGSIVATFRRSGKVVTGMREVGPPGVDAWRIGELERVARTLKTQAAPHEIAAANSLRLGMSDMGMMLAPASFFAALIIGIAALTAT